MIKYTVSRTGSRSRDIVCTSRSHLIRTLLDTFGVTGEEALYIANQSSIEFVRMLDYGNTYNTHCFLMLDISVRMQLEAIK